ncbi:MAG: RrF2 family transcriptional regulator [Dissulfurispiraceae bacterium]
MRLPAKVEYACMAVLELSLRYAINVPVQLGEIAAAQSIPEKFLIQILQRLKAAHIVGSSRGAAGGYFLARDPASITIADVVRAVDSTIFEKPGEVEGAKNTPGRELILRTWNALGDIIAGQLEQITFERLSNDLKNGQLTYYI